MIINNNNFPTRNLHLQEPCKAWWERDNSQKKEQKGEKYIYYLSGTLRNSDQGKKTQTKLGHLLSLFFGLHFWRFTTITAVMLYSGTCYQGKNSNVKQTLLFMFWTLLLIKIIAQHIFSRGIFTVKCKDFYGCVSDFLFQVWLTRDWQLLDSICSLKNFILLYKLFIKTHKVYSVDLIYYYHHYFKKIQ